MSLLQIPSPDLGAVGAKGSALYLLEAMGFSADGQTLLVKATFAGASPEQQRYGVWLYDVTTQTYTGCLNVSLAPLGVPAADINVLSAQTVGQGAQVLTVVQYAATDAFAESQLALIQNGVPQALWSKLGLPNPVAVERYAISADGRFLAVQTQDSTLAPNNSPDANDVSDIYLIDLKTLKTERVSMVGGAEVISPVNLGNVVVTDNKVQVTFSTDAKFVTEDRNETAASPSDAYQWSQSFDTTGLTGKASISLLSAVSGSTLAAAGGVLTTPGSLLATSAGVWFESTADNLVDGDNNAASDIFYRSSAGVVQKFTLAGIAALSTSAHLLSASADGSFAAVLIDAPEVLGANLGTPQVPQLMVWQRATQKWSIVSQAGSGFADLDVLSGVIAPNGQWTAFTTMADNLASGDPVALTAQLFVAPAQDVFNKSPTGSVTITGLAGLGRTLTASNTLADADGLGTVGYQWLADGTAIGGATSATLVLAPAQLGKKISVTASYTDGHGTPESVTSAQMAMAVVQTYDFGGQVYEWKTHALMSGVTLTADGSTVQSNASGHYDLVDLFHNKVDVSASKTVLSSEAQLAITSADVAAALQMAAGRNPNANGAPVTPYQFMAADINGDGKVTSGDALAILKMVQGASDAPAREWLFVQETQDFWNETTRAFSTTRNDVAWGKAMQWDAPGTHNLVAVLKGDVNGSWSAPAGTLDLDNINASYFKDLANQLRTSITQWGVLGV